MKRAELSEFSVEDEGFKLKIRRGGNGSAGNGGRNSNPPFVVAAAPPELASSATVPPIPVASPAPAQAPAEAEEANVAYIKSPMVGTFYRSPSPESKPFADVGTKVTETSAVCIIEAMKIMNEIQSEIKGTIVETLVEDGSPIEYGQRLFKVKTD